MTAVMGGAAESPDLCAGGAQCQPEQWVMLRLLPACQMWHASALPVMHRSRVCSRVFQHVEPNRLPGHRERAPGIPQIFDAGLRQAGCLVSVTPQLGWHVTEVCLKSLCDAHVESRRVGLFVVAGRCLL